MSSTSPSLLLRLRRPDDFSAWERFVDLYGPLLYQWAGRLGCHGATADDLVQECFARLVEKLPAFRYDPERGQFRGWLRTVLENCWRDWRGRPSPGVSLEHVAEPAGPDELERFWEVEFAQQVARRALRLMQADFEPTTWRAFWMRVVEDQSAAEVARELGLTVAAVHMARFHVLERLREELAGMLE